MKKSFAFILALLLICGVANATTAVYSGGTGVGTLKTVVLPNNSGAATTTAVSTSYIIPGKCKILWWRVVDTGYFTSGNTEVYASLSDYASATNGDTSSYLIDEIEQTSTATAYAVYEGGLGVSRGVVVRQGAQTCVTIGYIQLVP